MSLKRILLVLGSVLVILICTILPTFAIGIVPGYDQTFDYQMLYNPSGIDYSGISYIIGGNDEQEWNDYSIVWNRKYTGALGYETNLFSAYIPDHVQMMMYSFTLSMNVEHETNPRIVFNPFKATYDHTSGNRIHEYLGVCFKMDSVGAPGENTFVQLSIYDTQSMTLDYGSLTQYVMNGEHVVDENTGNIQVPIYITVNFVTDTIDVYLSNETGIVLVHSTRYEATDEDFTTQRFGVYDPIESGYGVGVYDVTLSLNDQETAQAYLAGLDHGKNEGFALGKLEGLSAGRAEGYWEGYAEGKRVGQLNVQVSEISIPEIFDSITESTVTLFKNIFGFELFGINISALIGSLAVVGVVTWLIRKLVK